VNNKQKSNLDNLNRDKRDKFLNNLEMAKNLLTVAGRYCNIGFSFEKYKQF